MDDDNIVEKVSEMNIEGKTHQTTLQDLILQSNQGEKTDISLNKLSSMPIIELLPKPELLSCRAIFYDLAFSSLKYPNISKKIK